METVNENLFIFSAAERRTFITLIQMNESFSNEETKPNPEYYSNKAMCWSS